jgi:galactokinase/mevalonate kinase-like predicted kinase
MAFRVKVPSRINLLGNPGDANEGDFATISAAINVYAYANIEIAEKIILEQKIQTLDGFKTLLRSEHTCKEIPLPYNGELDLVKASINRLYFHSDEFQRKIKFHGFKISIWSDVPEQSGLGGSSLIVILTLGGLRAIYELDPLFHNDYFIAELTQRAEAKEIKITAGYADRYVPVFGGIAYLDYRGKLLQKDINEEPYATYERLDEWGVDIPLIFISSGIERNSGDVHGKMRPIYLKEQEQWEIKGGEPPPMVRFMKSAWETAWRGKIALINKDWKRFGSLMNENHIAVDTMMTYCGFSDGSGWANNLLINSALENGCYGAKLTGAGGGGSVFAITDLDNLENVAKAWQRVAENAGLEKAKIFIPKIDRQGLKIHKAPKTG